jgi:hypothetical protein
MRAGDLARATQLLSEIPPLQQSFTSLVCYTIAGDVPQAAEYAKRAIRSARQAL